MGKLWVGEFASILICLSYKFYFTTELFWRFVVLRGFRYQLHSLTLHWLYTWPPSPPPPHPTPGAFLNHEDRK